MHRLLALIFVFLAAAAFVVPQPQPQPGGAWSLTFPTPAKATEFNATYPQVATHYPYGYVELPGQMHGLHKVTPSDTATSRVTGPNTLNVFVDGRFWPLAGTPVAQNGYAWLYARPISAKDAALVGGRRWVSALLSTRDGYPRLPAHWRIDFVVYPQAMVGSWDGLALYTDKGGQNGEVDCFEVYGGKIDKLWTGGGLAPLISGGKPYAIDARWKFFSTLHPSQGVTQATNQQTVAALTPGWVRGSCEMTDRFKVTLNGKVTMDVPAAGMDYPGRYITIGRDVDPRQSPEPAQAPSALIVQSLTVTPLP